VVLTDPNEYGEFTFEKDETYLYAGSWDTARLVRITLEPFARKDALNLSINGNHIEDMLIVSGFLYVAMYDEFRDTTRLPKIDLSLFQQVDYLETPSGIYGLTSLASDGSYLYSGTYTGEILKIDLATLTITDTLTLPEGFAFSLALENTNLFAGVGTASNVIFHRIDLTTFSIAESVTAPETGTNPLPEALHIAGDHLYATCRQGVKLLYKLTKSPLSIVDSMSLGGRDVWDVSHYGDFLYVSSIASSSPYNHLNKIRLADFTNVAELILEDGDRVEHIVI